jgi:hypothetical protein
VLYRQSLDVLFYIISSPGENELMLQAGFNAFYDAMSIIFKGQLEKRTLLDNLDVLLLTLDETFDDGYVNLLLETAKELTLVAQHHCRDGFNSNCVSCQSLARRHVRDRD